MSTERGHKTAQIHRFAATTGVEVLYKFRPFKSPSSKGRVREILEGHQIYFSRRSQLNDPFDLAPIIYFDRSKGLDPLRERLAEDAKRVWLRNDPHLTADQINDRLITLAVRDLDEFEIEARAKALERVETDYWVFSMAGNRSHPMLWSHYAEGHSGLCIHFLSDRATVFGAAQQVAYQEERPRVEFPLPRNDELLEKSTLWKGKFWDYEDEYRLLRNADMPYADVGLRFHGQHARFPARALVGVTVGTLMARPEVDEILTIAADHVPTLPVWKAHPTLTFEMEFERIS